MLPSPAFSYPADASAPFTGAVSHRGVLVRVAPTRWDGWGWGTWQTQTSWFTKVYTVWFTQTHFTSRSKGQHLHPTVQPPSTISRHFPCPFGGSPTGPSGCSWLQGLASSLGPLVLHCWDVELGSTKAEGATRPVHIRNLHKEGYGSPRLRGLCWCCAAGVCPPTFSSTGGEPKLLPTSLWEGTGFSFSSTDRWLLPKTV